MRDVQVEVKNCNNTPPVIASIPNVVVPVGTNYCVNVTASDTVADNISLAAYSAILPPATFVTTSSGPGSATGQFCFTPTLADLGNSYVVNILASDDNCNAVGTGAMSWLISVRGLGCGADSVAPVAVCQNLSVQVGNNSTATVLAQNVDNGSSDNCTVDSLALDVSAFDCSQTGTNPVTLTVYDQSGNSSTCTAQVTVVDTGSVGISEVNDTLFAGGSFVSYQWNQSGVPVSGATGATFAPLSQGWYTVTATNAFGCSYTSDSLFVDPLVGRFSKVDLDLDLFPNPSQGWFKLAGKALEGGGRLEVVDPLGRTLVEQVLEGSRSTVAMDLGHLPAGMYFVRFQDIQDRQITLRLVVE